MGQVRRVGDVYYIEFYARGLMYSQVAGSDLASAQELLAATEAKIAQGEALTVVRTIDLAVFYDQFLRQARELYSAKTLGRFQSTVRHFDAFLKACYPQAGTLSQITPKVVETYKEQLSKAHSLKIVNLTLLLLREMLEFGIKLGFINDNPTLHVRLMALPSTQVKDTPRSLLARDLFTKGLALGRVSLLLKISDVGKLMYYAKFIPLSYEDMYN